MLLREETPTYKILSGTAQLADIELLSVIIAGDQEKALAKARKILSVAPTLQKVGRLDRFDLHSLGLSIPEANRVSAAFEIARRRGTKDTDETVRVSKSSDAYDIIRPHIADLAHEEFWIIFLNKAMHVTGKKQMSVGGISGTVADPKMIMKACLDAKASGFIAAHNHPSGSTQPSQADITLTRNLTAAGKILELPLLDHVIVSFTGFYSFADEGMLY